MLRQGMRRSWVDKKVLLQQWRCSSSAERPVRQHRWGYGRIPGRGIGGSPNLKDADGVEFPEGAKEREAEAGIVDGRPQEAATRPTAQKCRHLLCEAFGVGGWQFVPLTTAQLTPGGKLEPEVQRQLRRSFALVVKGVCLAKTEQEVSFSGLPEENILVNLTQLSDAALVSLCHQINIV